MNVEILAPESLNEITLFQYQEWANIKEPTNKDVLRVFLRLQDDIIDKVPKVQVDSVAEGILKLFEEPAKHATIFEMKGVQYGFIPKLDDITYGEHTDVSTYLGDWDQMHKAMAVLYRPITKRKGNKYLISEYNGTSELSETMRNMPLSVVMGSIVFFYNLSKELLSCIPNYIQKQLTKEQLAEVVSLQSGENTTKYTQSLREILDGLTRLLNYPSIAV